jgi:hypothetical protein
MQLEKYTSNQKIEMPNKKYLGAEGLNIIAKLEFTYA